MAEAQAALESVAMYFDTLMLMVKVITACMILDSVCLFAFGCAWCVSQWRRS